jgi:hypothetical protein
MMYKTCINDNDRKEKGLNVDLTAFKPFELVDIITDYG